MEILKKIIYVIACVFIALVFALASTKVFSHEGDYKMPVFNIQKADESVVMIAHIDGSFKATGFYVGKDTIVTNAHVVIEQTSPFSEGEPLSHVLCWNKAGDVALGQVTYIDETQDVAFITLINNDLGLTALVLATTIPARGHTIYSVGHPLAQLWSFSKGYVSHKAQRQKTGEIRVTADMLGTFGASGSPVMNSRNELVGILSQVMSAGSGVFYIPLSVFIDKLP